MYEGSALKLCLEDLDFAGSDLNEIVGNLFGCRVCIWYLLV